MLPALIIATGAVIAAVADGKAPWGALAAVSAVYLVQNLVTPIQAEIAQVLGRRVDEALTERLMVMLSGPSGLAHIEDPAIHDAVARAQGTFVNVTPGAAVSRLAWTWKQRIWGAGSLVIVGTWHWWAAVGLVPIYVLTYVASRWHWHQTAQVSYARADELRRSHYVRRLALAPALAKEARVFGLGPWLVDRYRTGWLTVMRDVWRRRREGWLVALGSYGLVAVAEGLIAGAIGTEAMTGELILGHAVTLIGAVVAAGFLGVFHDSAWYANEAANTLVQFEKLEQTIHLAHGVVGGTASADELPRRRICFEGLRFGYPGRKSPVFAALDLEIEAGRSLAIVGDNGAGKTTLVKLLARLYDPDAGRITVDGIDLRDLASRSWHQRIAAIFQDFTQYELSAEDNVSFGAVHHRGDRDRVQRAATAAGAAPVIARLAAGWDTPLGHGVSGGTQLSGGEWQRLALARALFAVQAGAGVLVLDEPTASLDVRGETELHERLFELIRGVTTIVISHRFSTVRRADRIIVLEHGCVVEDGSHDALVAAGGKYAAMYALQASRFEAPEDGDA